MAFVHSKETRVLFDDLAVSGNLRSMTSANSRTLSPSTSFLDDGEKFTPGLMQGVLTLEGMFDGSAIHTKLGNRISTDTDDLFLASAAPGGFAVGKPVLMALGDQSSYGVHSAVADAVSFTSEVAADEVIDIGVSLHDLSGETATAAGAEVDNVSSTDNGGVGALHVTSASGTSPTLDVKIQHSTDDVTYVDLITFTQATAAASERKTVAGTVNRYIRAQWTIGGTAPSFSFMVAFARR